MCVSPAHWRIWLLPHELSAFLKRRIHIKKTIAQVSNMFQGLKRNVIRYLKHESYISAKKKVIIYVIIKI